jgi:hypothetical protein
MSVLIGGGLVKPGLREDTATVPAKGECGRVRGRVRIRPRRGTGETHRPPASGTVAGHRPARVVGCGPRPASRWPWLAGSAVAMCLIITGLGQFANGMAVSGLPAVTATVSPAPGETLSDLAMRFAPSSDVAAVVERIKQLNSLDDDALVPGVPLTVPIQPGVATAGS